MTFWTETAIAKHLDGRFYQLQQKSLGKFTVVDLNEPEEDEPPIIGFHWTDHELAYLLELKRQGYSHRKCADALRRTYLAVVEKWQHRLEWAPRIENPRPENKIWLNQIARIVCDVFEITKEEFVSHRRRFCIARHIFFWLSRKYTSHSLPQIGAFCGGRDHSTVCHGIRMVEGKPERYRAQLELCEFDLKSILPKQEAA